MSADADRGILALRGAAQLEDHFTHGVLAEAGQSHLPSSVCGTVDIEILEQVMSMDLAHLIQ
jgi:hypothetical protein